MEANKYHNYGELDSTTKNIVKELMRECTNRNIPVTEEFIIYYVQLLMLNPSWNLTTETLPERVDVIKFVNFVLGRVQNQSCPRIRTLKLQLHFRTAFHNVDNMVAKNRTSLKEKLRPLENDILETQADEAVKENLFRKIVYLITLYSGLGNPIDSDVYKEAQLALSSVFSMSELEDFMKQASSEKELQIVALTELTTGIRLFNKDCQKGGAGIEDLPKLLMQAIKTTKTNIYETLAIIMDYVTLLMNSIDNCYETCVDEQNNYSLVNKLPEGIELHDVIDNINLLIIYRQKEVIVKKILIEVKNLEIQTEKTINKLQEALMKLQETVKLRVVIPTVQVFPQFTDIANIWCQLQDQAVALSQFNQILLEVNLITNDMFPNMMKTETMIGPAQPLLEAERLQQTNHLKIGPFEGDVTVLYPGDVENFEELPLQYMGFCAWKFVETLGALIPGNPNMGVIQVQNMYFAFSTLEAAAAFAKDPAKFILKALELARLKPVLINFCQLQPQLKVVRQIKTLVPEIEIPIETFDVQVQTDLHPEPTKIDPNYMWNVWDWKRQAILLADLSRRLTHSTQTEKSNAWNAASTQTYETKEVMVQTQKDNYTNVPTVSNYIYGLRGRKDAVQHVITLTRPVNE